MRVPPRQSGTGASTRCQRHVGVAVAQAARDVREPRAEDQHVHRDASAASGRGRSAGACARSDPSSPRCRAARRAAAARVRGRVNAGASASRLARHAQHRRAQVDPAARGARSMAAPAHRRAAAAASGRRGAAPARTRRRVIVAKSARCSRSRRENVKRGSNCSSSLGPWSPASAALAGAARRSARRAGRARRAALRRAALTFGSISSIIFSSSFGSRQNASNAASKSGCCSWRSIITAASAACTSSRRSTPTRSSACDRSEHPVGTHRQAGAAQHAREVHHVFGESRPHRARPARCAATGVVIRSRRRAALQQPVVSPLCSSRDVVLVLEQHAQRVVHGRRIERDAFSATSALVQSIVSAMPGALNRSSVRMRCTKSTTCASQPLRGVRRLAAARSPARARRRDSRPSGRGSGASAHRGSRACGSR